MPFVPDKPASRFVPDAPAQSPNPGERADYQSPPVMDVLKEGVKRLPDTIGGVLETGLSGVTGLLSSAKNLANAATGATKLFKNDGEGDADFLRRSREETTYSPRTNAGKDIAEGMNNTVGKVIGGAGEAVGKLIGSDTAKELTGDLINVGLAKGGMKGAKAPEILKGKEPIKEYDIHANPVESLRAAGVKLRPSDASVADPALKATGGKQVEKQVGSDELRKSFLAPNTKTFTRLAAEEVGLPKDVKLITPKMLDTQRQPHLAKYEEVGSTVGKFDPSPEFGADIDAISNKTGLDPKTRREIARDVSQYRDQNSGPGAVKTMSVLRRKAAKWLQSDDPKVHDQAIAYRETAAAIESELERQLETKNPQLIDDFRNSRQELAKLHDVESSLRIGQVDAHKMMKLSDKGAPLTGNLSIIADAARTAPHVTRHPQTVSNISGGGSVPMLSPVLDIATLGARPLGRRLLGSDIYQNQLGREGLPAKPAPAAKAAPPSPPPPPNYGPRSGPTLTLEDKPNLPPGGDAVPFEPTTPHPLAERLAGDLQLAEDAPVRPRFDDSLATKLAGKTEAESPLAAESPDGPFAYGNGKVPYRDPGAAEPVLSSRQMLEAGKTKTNDLTLADHFAPSDLPPGKPTPPAPEGKPTPNAPYEIVPGNKPGYFAIKIPGEKTATQVKGQAAAKSLADELFGNDDSFEPTYEGVDDGISNNASGESSASVEAINRVKSEKEAGRDRFIIERDGTVRPLHGVDAVDAAARDGQVIVQRGVGDKEYSILDRGNLSKSIANGKLNAAMEAINELRQPKKKAG